MKIYDYKKEVSLLHVNFHSKIIKLQICRNTLLLASKDQLYIYELGGQNQLLHQISAPNHLLRVDLCGNGRDLAFTPSMVEGNIILINTLKPKTTEKIRNDAAFPITKLKFNSQGTSIAASSFHNNKIKVYCVLDGQKEEEFNISGNIIDFSFCPHGSHFCCLSEDENEGFSIEVFEIDDSRRAVYTDKNP